MLGVGGAGSWAVRQPFQPRGSGWWCRGTPRPPQPPSRFSCFLFSFLTIYMTDSEKQVFNFDEGTCIDLLF